MERNGRLGKQFPKIDTTWPFHLLTWNFKLISCSKQFPLSNSLLVLLGIKGISLRMQYTAHWNDREDILRQLVHFFPIAVLHSISLSVFTSLVLMVEVCTSSLGKQFHSPINLPVKKNNKGPKETSTGTANRESREGKTDLCILLSYYKRVLNKLVTKDLSILQITVPVSTTDVDLYGTNATYLY